MLARGGGADVRNKVTTKSGEFLEKFLSTLQRRRSDFWPAKILSKI